MRTTKFNRIFHRLYHVFPIDIQPFEAATQLYYMEAHDTNISFYLRERRSKTLEKYFTYVEELESNLWASGILSNHNDEVENDSMISLA